MEGARGPFFDLDSQRQSLTTLLSISWKSCKGNSLGKGGSISDFTLWLGVNLGGWKTLGGKLIGKQCFPLFGKRRKMRRKENPGENFLSRAHKIHPPKSRGKCWRESALTALLQKFPLPTSITTQRDRIRRRKQKITTQPPNPPPPPPPNTAT